MKKQSFAEKLQELRRPNETQQHFAQRIGLNRNTLAQYLSNKNEKPASTDVIIQIAEACNVSADWLLGLSSSKKSKGKLREVADFLHLSDDSVDNLTSLNPNILDSILSNKKTLKLFSRMLDNIVFASLPRSPVYDDNNVIVGLMQDKREFHCVLAGRCAEKIADIISKGDEQ